MLSSLASTSALAAATIWWRRERFHLLERLQKLNYEAAQERRARIRHEISAREIKNITSGYVCLGNIRTMFPRRYGTPRQGALARSTIGVINIDPKILDGSALEGLDKYSFVWLLFIFHENTNEHKTSTGKTYKSKIKAPGLLGEKTGILSTRSPHRPSRIGLSLVKIVKVEPDRRRLVVSAVDLLDGTPIVDIKPFVPMDIPWDFIAYPDWVTRSMNDGLTTQNAPLTVSFSEEAKEQLELILKNSEYCSLFFSNVSSAVDVISEALRLDFRAVHHGRYGEATQPQYETLKCKICDFELQLSVRGKEQDADENSKILLIVEKVWREMQNTNDML